MKFLPSPSSNVLGAALLLPILLGFFFPEFFWATHAIHFLPLGLRVLLLVAAFACFLPSVQLWLGGLIQRIPSGKEQVWWLFGGVTIALIGGTFHNFPIAFDNYGEAFNYTPFLDEKVLAIPQETWDWLLTFDLKPASGRRTLLSLYTLSAYLTGWNYASVFKWFDTVFGILFIALWLWALLKNVSSTALRIVLWLGAISAPLTLVFYGHLDTYSVVYTALLAWLVLLMQSVKDQSKRKAVYLIPGLLLLVKLHPLMVLLFPALGLALVHSFWSARSWARHLLTAKGLIGWVLLPIFSAGAVLYFLVFEDYVDARLLQNARDFDRLFLPLFSPEPPLDRYNMMSWPHILDAFNALLWWSPVLVFVGLLLGIRAKKETWTSPLVLILGLTLLLFSAFLFTINPLISMPMDWDLFSIPGIVFFVLVLALASAQRDFENDRPALGVALGLSLLCLPLFIVHSSKAMLSKRLTSVGVWVYQSYYEHSARYIHQAIGAGANDPQSYLDRKLEVMQQLKRHALLGNDVKYASMCTDNALVYWKSLSNYSQAKNAFEEAIAYDPSYALNRWHYLQLLDELGEKDQAFEQAEALLQQSYPTEKEAALCAIKWAKESGNAKRFSYYCNAYQMLLKNEVGYSQLCAEVPAP